MGGRVLQFIRCVDARESADQIVPEKHFQMSKSVRASVHEPDPGENHRSLQDNPRYSCQRRSSRQRFSQTARVTRANAGTIQATALLQRKPNAKAACIKR